MYHSMAAPTSMPYPPYQEAASTSAHGAIPPFGPPEALALHDAREAAPGSPSDIVGYCGDIPITESSRCTHLLAGTTFQDSSVIDLKGKRSIVFVFSDLAGRQEGTFVLRYRVFHIFSQATGPRPMPVIAECFGGPFRIYSTKDFPGLRASTDLTKNISLFGIRTNIRARERKRRKTNDFESADRPQTPVESTSASSSNAPTSPVTNGSVRRKRGRAEETDAGGEGQAT